LRDWRRRCAMIFQQFNLVHRLDVLTNVLVGRVARSTPRSLCKLFSRRERALAMLTLERERAPELWAVSGQSVGMQGRQCSRDQVLGHWLFWLMFPALLGPAAFTLFAQGGSLSVAFVGLVFLVLTTGGECRDPERLLDRILRDAKSRLD